MEKSCHEGTNWFWNTLDHRWTFLWTFFSLLTSLMLSMEIFYKYVVVIAIYAAAGLTKSHTRLKWSGDVWNSEKHKDTEQTPLHNKQSITIHRFWEEGRDVVLWFFLNTVIEPLWKTTNQRETTITKHCYFQITHIS